MTGKPFLTKNLIVFAVVLIFFWFGVIFYDFIQSKFGFAYVDELIALFCMISIVYFRVIKRGKVKTVSFIALFIIVFYFIYSFSIGSNVHRAIIDDFVVVTKPIIAILFIWELNPHFSSLMLKTLSNSTLIASIYIIGVGFSGESVIYYMFGHPSRMATATLISALLYFFTNRFDRKTILVFTLMLGVSLLSFRSKAYGSFVIAAIPLWVFYKQLSRNTFRFKLKHSLVFLAMLLMVVITAWPKIHYYFITGTENPENMFARPALYLTSLEIAKDYFPFGSGLASYASHFSAEYYSPIYYQYNLSHLQGLSEIQPSFISDSFFPQLLGQFGVVGLLLFGGSFFFIMKKAYRWYLRTHLGGNYLYLVFCIVICIMIESIADTTLVQNRGMFIMMLLGLALQKLYRPTIIIDKMRTGKFPYPIRYSAKLE